MKMPVGQLPEYLAKRDENTETMKLGDLSASDDAIYLYHGDGLTKKQIVLDETAAKALVKYLKVPHPYYNRLTPDMRKTVLSYEFKRHADVDVSLELLNNELVSVHDPSIAMMPLSGVAAAVEEAFEPEDSIRRLIINDTRFHLDVTSAKHAVTFPAKGDVSVGDITEAGIGFLSYPFQNVAPSASVYAERLVCMNGQRTDERLHRIPIKGQTVAEVEQSLKTATSILVNELDDYLEKLTESREIYVPGSPQAFAQQVAREYKLSREVLDLVIEQINQLDEPVTAWDVNQIFTSLANNASTYGVMTKLQNIGGSLAFDAERMIDRCGTCERLL